MRLSSLLGGPPGRDGDPEVLTLTHDSRRVGPGALFVTWKGESFDGADFALEAEKRGAVAVVGEGPRPEGLEIPWIPSEEPRRLMARLAARLAQHPDREMSMVGVTGTNGKSTVVALVTSLFEAAGRPCAQLGTLGYRLGELELGRGRTTPEASDLFGTLREARRHGAEAAALEVSSHALSLERVGELQFDVAVFTNLTRDHLDFHRDEERYFAAKKHLFELRKPGGRAVVWVDDPRGAELASELGSDTITVGEAGKVRSRGVELSPEGLRTRVETPRGELALRSRLLGGFNLANLLVAVGVAEALELPSEAIEAGVVACSPLPGRMERVDPGGRPTVVVDFAHTPAALTAALTGMREIGTEHLIAVFGCGGGRDRGKRAPMGRIAGELAELPIATTDNPRGEDPLAILAAVEEGLRASGNPNYRVVPDRREAIHRAIHAAGPRSGVLIAGKGNEEEQIVGAEQRPFSDRDEARAALCARRPA